MFELTIIRDEVIVKPEDLGEFISTVESTLK